jgi:hypothetical protein
MESKISIVEIDSLQEKIQIVMRQTNYDEITAKEKLNKFEYDEIRCIRDYMGITEKKAPAESKSLNQLIYKEIRNKMGVTNQNKLA